MSIQTWKDEFYPEPAIVFNQKLGSGRTELEAVRHSLKKWEGLLPENMSKHEVRWGFYSGLVGNDNDPCVDLGNDFVEISGSTCSLCARHRHTCRTCPLDIVRGGVPCDARMEGEQAAPYKLKKHDPSVMVMWLKRAEDYVLNQPVITYTGGY